MKIAIANDHPIALTALCWLIQSSQDLNKDFTATAISEGDIPKLSPADILFVSVNCHSTYYQTFLRQVLTSLKNQCKIIIHFDEMEFEKALHLLRRGASGIISQRASLQELISCIRHVSENKPYVCQRTVQRMLNHMGINMPGHE